MTDTHAACLRWIRSISPPGVTVVHQHQNAPVPPPPYVSLTIASGREIATYRGAINNEGRQPVVRWVAFTLSIQAFGGGPFDAHHLINWIADRLEFSELRVDSLGREVVFNSIANGPTQANIQEGGRWEARGLLDLQMSEARRVIFDVGLIEEVHFSGDIGDHPLDGKPSAKNYTP